MISGNRLVNDLVATGSAPGIRIHSNAAGVSINNNQVIGNRILGNGIADMYGIVVAPNSGAISGLMISDNYIRQTSRAISLNSGSSDQITVNDNDVRGNTSAIVNLSAGIVRIYDNVVGNSQSSRTMNLVTFTTIPSTTMQLTDGEIIGLSTVGATTVQTLVCSAPAVWHSHSFVSKNGNAAITWAEAGNLQVHGGSVTLGDNETITFLCDGTTAYQAAQVVTT
jgi:hypothetical protein